MHLFVISMTYRKKPKFSLTQIVSDIINIVGISKTLEIPFSEAVEKLKRARRNEGIVSFANTPIEREEPEERDKPDETFIEELNRALEESIEEAKMIKIYVGKNGPYQII